MYLHSLNWCKCHFYYNRFTSQVKIMLWLLSVDDFLMTGKFDVIDQTITQFNAPWSFGTVIHGPGFLRFKIKYCTVWGIQSNSRQAWAGCFWRLFNFLAFTSSNWCVPQPSGTWLLRFLQLLYLLDWNCSITVLCSSGKLFWAAVKLLHVIVQNLVPQLYTLKN